LRTGQAHGNEPLARRGGRGVGSECIAPQTRTLLFSIFRIALVILTVPLSRISAAASDATPRSGSPTACEVSPRSEAELAELLARSNLATPVPTTGGQTIPAGTPANTDDIRHIDQTVRQWLACENAGEPLRAWALFSDGYLHRLLFRQGPLTDASYAALATPSPSGGPPAVVKSIEGERMLPDGRLGAMVTITYPSVPMPKRFFLYFTRSGSRLLIDGILGEISFSVP
jgi:hypothetical protein